MTYVSHIADTILSHSDDPVVLGPEMYTAIAEWEKREIPAGIVLTSIEEVYMQTASGKDIPVEMFQDAVIRNFITWLSRTGEREAAAV